MKLFLYEKNVWREFILLCDLSNKLFSCIINLMIDEYIGWPTHVNRVILSETKINIGTNARNEETLKSGGKRSELAGAFCPDIYTVTMDFEADSKVKIKNPSGQVIGQLNKTEYQLFVEWFKYKHRFGLIPFEFPKIIYSPQSGIYSLDQGSEVEYYKITSVVECVKSGSCMRITMTWQSVYGGQVMILEDSASINGITKVTNQYIDITFSSISDTAPTQLLFTLYIDDEEQEISGFFYDDAYTVRLYFEELQSGTHTFSFSMSEYGGLSVENGTYSATMEVV